MNRISLGQFTALLLASDAFSLICLTHSVTVLSLCGFAIGTIIQFLAAVPTIFCLSRGEKITRHSINRCIFLIYSLMWGGLLFVRLWQTSEIVYIPSIFGGIVSDRLLITALVGVVCLYISSTGLKPLARASVIVGGFGILCLFIVIFGAIGKMDFSNFNRNSDGFSTEIVRGLSLSGSLGTFAILAENLRYNKVKTTIFYFISRIVLSAIIFIIAIIVAGGLKLKFPIIAAFQLSQPLSSQRIDALFIIIFSVLAIISIALQATVSADILHKIFPKISSFRTTISLILMTLAGFALSKSDVYSPLFAFIILAATIVPSMITIARQKGK